MIDLVCEQMADSISTLRLVKVNERKVEIDDSISFILLVTFNLPDKIKMEFVHLNVKFASQNKVSFRGEYFECPSELHSLFDMIKEHKLR